MGAMGRAMAKNLAAAGHQVKAWNRSRVEVDGVTTVASPVDVFQGDAVLTMLSDDAAIEATLVEPKVLEQAKSGVVHVVASTISVAFAQKLVSLHESAGVEYVSAPVLGRPDVAAKGELNILAAGAPAAVERVRPLLEVVGGRIWDLGVEPPTANAAKIACNMMITMAIEAMAEAVVLRKPMASAVLGSSSSSLVRCSARGPTRSTRQTSPPNGTSPGSRRHSALKTSVSREKRPGNSVAHYQCSTRYQPGWPRRSTPAVGNGIGP